MAAILAQIGEASTSSSTAPPPSDPADGKPVIVTVKRKASQGRLDALWLEISERPPKKPALDLANLSISDSDTGAVKEVLGTKKLLMHRVETVRDSDAISDVLHSLLQDPNNQECKRRSEGHKRIFKPIKSHSTKQDQLRSVAREEHKDLGRNARFQQIWKSRRGSINAEENSLHEICHLYDVIRVDVEVERQGRVQKHETVDDSYSEHSTILSNYLPLMREFLPQAAAEIESDMESVEGNYVYDLYTVGDGLDVTMEDPMEYPLVQVNGDNDECNDCPSNSDYETDDSNAEDNPRNDYPDEESSGDEDECDDPFGEFEGSDSGYEREEVDADDDGNWKWEYR